MLGRALVLALASLSPALGAERPPAGDLPGSQPFVAYVAPHYRIEVPEGWSQHATRDGVRFTLRAFEVAIASGTRVVVGGAPIRTAHAMARLTRSRATSDPDPVTGKRFLLERLTYVFVRGGRAVSITLAGPIGADNADVWKRITDSFLWR
ncbi:MAG: lipoprotein [Vulcanimicrobiaceae bacterium]